MFVLGLLIIFYGLLLYILKPFNIAYISFYFRSCKKNLDIDEVSDKDLFVTDIATIFAYYGITLCAFDILHSFLDVPILYLGAFIIMILINIIGRKELNKYIN